MTINLPVETALRLIITGLSGFAELDPLPTVRPYKISQVDFKYGTGARAIIIESPEEDHQVDLDARGGGVSASASVESVSEEFDDAWLVAEVIRTNGTSPASGITAFQGTVGGLFIQRISVDKTLKGFVPYEEGSDEGYYFINRQLTVDFTEIA